MQQIKQYELVPFPETEVVESFKFDTLAQDGTFTFEFKWLNGRWNVWVTLPNGTVREAGVLPNIVSWSGFRDYGLMFKTTLPEISFNNLFLTEMYIIKWQ